MFDRLAAINATTRQNEKTLWTLRIRIANRLGVDICAPEVNAALRANHIHERLMAEQVELDRQRGREFARRAKGRG
jgi:hypothetical protein